MRNLLVAALILAASAAHAFDGPYFTKLYDPKTGATNGNVSLGAIMDEKGVVKSGAFGSLNVLWHPADADNSLIPKNWQTFLPPEAWTLLSVGYGDGFLGAGANINLGSTAQSYASQALQGSGNASLSSFGAAIKPGASGLAINAGPEWFCKVVSNSVLLPFDQWKGTPGWFIGGSYTKKFSLP
jgi:hypothetical protein